jgi:hypothetical protein
MFCFVIVRNMLPEKFRNKYCLICVLQLFSYYCLLIYIVLIFTYFSFNLNIFLTITKQNIETNQNYDHHNNGNIFLPLLRRFNPTEPVVEKSVIL